MPDINLLLTLVILIAALGLFISGKFRVDLIAICTLVLLLVTGLIRPEQSLSGFTNQATGTIAAMFVISAGLVRTGLLQWISRRIDILAGKKELQLILVLCLVTAFLSAFLVNTAVVAIFIPVAIMLAHERKIPASRVLIPLSFASQFGGVCTIIGTSTNMLVNGIAIDKGIKPFGFFEFAPLGIILVIAGTVYLLTAGRWLLPRRKEQSEQSDAMRFADYHAELMVLGDSPLAGKKWAQSKIEKENKIKLTNLIREGEPVTRPATTVIRPGDLLIVSGNLDKIIDISNKNGLELIKNTRIKANLIDKHGDQLVEILIPPVSTLIGKALHATGFFRRYNTVIMALQRRGRPIKTRIEDIELEEGDTLLIQTHDEDITRLLASKNVIVTNRVNEFNFRKDKAIIALLVMVVTMSLAITNIFPIIVAAIIGSLGMVLTRCITIQEAYEAIDWKIIFLLGGIIPLGIALEQNGVIQWLIDNTLQQITVHGPIVILVVLYFITAMLTESISNNAAAAILAPVAIVIASTMNVDARPFLMAIAFAASTSFATPIGYQTNTMIYSPGGYCFLDFIKIGAPLNIIFLILATLLIPLFWPF